jgi:AraC family transcriptional activator of pobA
MKKRPVIPVNQFGDDYISIERVVFDELPELEKWEQPERHDRHAFFLLEKGCVTMDIDFQRYEIRSPSIIYMHPDQVHRILGFKSVSVIAWAIHNESLTPENLNELEALAPVAPMPLTQESLELISETASLCLKFADRQIIINALIGLVISLLGIPLKNNNRFEIITKSFRKALDQGYTELKRPSDYARQLNISIPYLNECIKNTTGHSVSFHIHQRTILEAKRLLYHSNQSLKEIAAAVGFNDYAYFSRLFTKIVGVNPLSFRIKNRD